MTQINYRAVVRLYLFRAAPRLLVRQGPLPVKSVFAPQHLPRKPPPHQTNPHVIFNSTAYPHILTAILAPLPRQTLLACRLASRALKTAADATLAHHLTLSPTLSTPTGRLPTTHLWHRTFNRTILALHTDTLAAVRILDLHLDHIPRQRLRYLSGALPGLHTLRLSAGNLGAARGFSAETVVVSARTSLFLDGHGLHALLRGTSTLVVHCACTTGPADVWAADEMWCPTYVRACEFMPAWTTLVVMHHCGVVVVYPAGTKEVEVYSAEGYCALVGGEAFGYQAWVEEMGEARLVLASQ